MGKLILQTERLLLREMEDEDFSALCRMLRDPEVMYAYEHAFSEEEAWDWLRRQQERYRRDGFGLWGMAEKTTGEMVGQCGLTWQPLGDGTQMPEVGYLLEKSACTRAMPPRPPGPAGTMPLTPWALTRCAPSFGTTIGPPRWWPGETA